MEEVTDDLKDLKKAGGKAAGRIRSAGENAYEEVSEAVEDGAEEATSIGKSLWATANDAASGAWDMAKSEIERKPLRSAGIALAVGLVVGALLSSRD